MFEKVIDLELEMKKDKIAKIRKFRGDIINAVKSKPEDLNLEEIERRK